ncbi:radical SAM protein [Candidatus Bathyarchaeota archaeon]|nr:MAG: radical SAM protein [Candidatus Bathyarchaeota archaeon]
MNRHKKRDEWFLDDYSVNPYMFCQFGCIYCYIRGSIYGRGLRNQVLVKVNAPELLSKELRRRAAKEEFGFIALGSSTEPWMPIEEKYYLTRRCLSVIAHFRFPVHCLTKSTLILRDADILMEIEKVGILPQDLKGKIRRKALVTFSLSTLNEDVARIFEPNAPNPIKRLNALRELRKRGLYAGIAYIPLLPYISDGEDNLREMVKAARDYGADYVFFGVLTLYGEGKALYFNVLKKRFPELLQKYKKIYRKRFQPNVNYVRELEYMARDLCNRYNVRYMLT